MGVINKYSVGGVMAVDRRKRDGCSEDEKSAKVIEKARPERWQEGQGTVPLETKQKAVMQNVKEIPCGKGQKSGLGI